MNSDEINKHIEYLTEGDVSLTHHTDSSTLDAMNMSNEYLEQFMYALWEIARQLAILRENYYAHITERLK